MVQATDPDSISLKRKAICALLPYAIFLEQGGHQEMVNAIFRAFRASLSRGFMWHRARPYITALFDERSPPSLNRVVALASPLIRWDDMLNDGTKAVARWTAAALEVQYTEEVGQNVVDALLQIAQIHSLRRQVPMEIWASLKKLPSLPPECQARFDGSSADVVSHIRGLNDIEILKSYFLLIWSEWGYLRSSGLDVMVNSMREDFNGAELHDHRVDLIKRLDYVLGELDKGLEYLKQRKPRIDAADIDSAKTNYNRLRRVLVEVDPELE